MNRNYDLQLRQRHKLESHAYLPSNLIDLSTFINVLRVAQRKIEIIEL